MNQPVPSGRITELGPLQEPMMKFCKDCKWYTFVSGKGEGAYCLHPILTKVDLVTGESIYRKCIHIRNDMDACGPWGNLWEPKES